MVALESKAWQGLLVPLGPPALLVFQDTRDLQASKEIQGCLAQRARGDTGDPPDLREILESLVQKDRKGQQEIMEERDQEVQLARQAEWDHRVSPEWKESQ